MQILIQLYRPSSSNRFGFAMACNVCDQFSDSNITTAYADSLQATWLVIQEAGELKPNPNFLSSS